MNIVPSEKIVASERGAGAKGPDGKFRFTACRFAEIAKQARGQGYDVPLGRKPGDDNFVFDLQQAGDRTLGDGSTMRQGQKAIRALLPDADFQFGTITDAELFDFVSRGATVSFSVNCGKLPRYLKNFVGYGYNGGHYQGTDTVYGTPDDFDIDLSDAMYRPAKNAKVRRVPWSDVKDAVIRHKGDLLVTMSWLNSAYLKQQLEQAVADLGTAQQGVTDAESAVTAATEAAAAAETAVEAAQARVDAINAQLGAMHT